MRYAIIADIHGNYDALEAVLEDIADAEIDGYYCVGDIVGYGAEPDRCVDRIAELCKVVVAGNHDYAAIEKTSIEYFNTEARNTVLWTRDFISAEHKNYLSGLELVHEEEHFTLVHSTLHAPELFHYVLDNFDAELCFQRLVSPVCFIAHSHVPIVFHKTDRIEQVFQDRLELTPDELALVNVGSVGQPRDQDPRASYCLYDTDSRVIEIRRVEYNIESAAQKILDAGLPPTNALRIRLGR